MSNPLLNIPKLPFFDIPINFFDGAKKPYLNQLKYQFKQITLFLDSCKDSHYAPDIKTDVIVRVKRIQRALISVINEYLDGHPSRAFILFENAIEENNLKDDLLALQQISIPSNSLFFRTQKHFGSIPKKLLNSSGFLNLKTPLELFHPAFERRRSVGTNRFSISGYPSLYLSKSLPTSYSECYPHDSYGAFHAIGLKNVRPLYLIDLTKDSFKKNKNLFKALLPKLTSGLIAKDDVGGILEYLGVYQLIMASHTKVNYKPVYPNEIYYFKAEYIIPQLLLQWIQLKGLAIDGIQYRSCTGVGKFTHLEHYNFILPVKSNLSKGFCPSLESIFYCSNVHSYLIQDKPRYPIKLLNDIEANISKSTFATLV